RKKEGEPRRLATVAFDGSRAQSALRIIPTAIAGVDPAGLVRIRVRAVVIGRAHDRRTVDRRPIGICAVAIGWIAVGRVGALGGALNLKAPRPRGAGPGPRGPPPPPARPRPP